jgi:hypothetical protein
MFGCARGHRQRGSVFQPGRRRTQISSPRSKPSHGALDPSFPFGGKGVMPLG